MQTRAALEGLSGLWGRLQVSPHRGVRVENSSFQGASEPGGGALEPLGQAEGTLEATVPRSRGTMGPNREKSGFGGLLGHASAASMWGQGARF